MINLAEEQPFLQLVHWNMELPSSSAQDPLGLNLRLAARMADKLLHCITSITPRARYYSFFAWAFKDYFENEKGTPADRGLRDAIVQRERGFVLGSVLHHGGAPCEGGALGGSEAATTLIQRGILEEVDLARWKHLKNHQGNLGAAYKGSLINLGYFETPEDGVGVQDDVESVGDELSEKVQNYEVIGLKSIAHELANAFAQSVSHTTYIREGWSLRRKCPMDVLKGFGSAAGLCELVTREESADRDMLREVFFATHASLYSGQAHHNRQKSLTFILWLIKAFSEQQIPFTSDRFGCVVFYKRSPVNDGTDVFYDVSFPSALTDIAECWRIYYFHHYLTITLQSLLGGVVRVAREHPAGVKREALLNRLKSNSVGDQIGEALGVPLEGAFLDLTPAETLKAGGIELGVSSENLVSGAAPDIASSFSEWSLSRALLDDDLANQAAGPAVAATLLYVLFARHEQSVAETYKAWHKNNVYDRYSDVSLPGVVVFLQSTFGKQWWNLPNRKILDGILWRFVVRQHEAMAYERGFGGSPSLIRVDGNTVIPTDVDYNDPSTTNVRLPRAVQILKDLRLIEMRSDENDVLSLTPDGRAWLNRYLQEKATDARAKSD